MQEVKACFVQLALHLVVLSHLHLLHLLSGHLLRALVHRSWRLLRRL